MRTGTTKRTSTLAEDGWEKKSGDEMDSGCLWRFCTMKIQFTKKIDCIKNLQSYIFMLLFSYSNTVKFEARRYRMCEKNSIQVALKRKVTSTSTSKSPGLVPCLGSSSLIKQLPLPTEVTMPSTPRNVNDRDLEEGLPASLPASSSEPSGLILPSTAEQHTGIGRSAEDDSGQEPPSSVLAETQIETIDDEDSPAPFDPSAFEVDDEDMTNNIETVDDDAAPAPFDPSAYEVDDEDKTNNVKTVDDGSPPAPFGSSEFEVDEGVREGGNNSVQTPSEIDPIPIPQREDIEEGRDQSLTRSVRSSRAGMLLANINDSRHLHSGESPTNPVERNAHSLGVDARTVDVVSLRTYAPSGTSADVLLRTDAPTSRYAVGDDAGSAAEDSRGTDAAAFRPALERDSTFCVPVAWPVPLADEGEVIIATPTLPWWKQRRIQLLLIILAALSIALGVTLTRPPGDDFSAALSLSITPSSSITPSASPSFSTFPSASPTEVCFWIEISIMYDAFPEQTSWELSREVNNTWNLYKEGDSANGAVELVSLLPYAALSFFDSLCLQGGKYKFEIIDTGLDGICCRNGGWGYYNVTTSNGGVIAEGGKFGGSESATFTIPFVTAPSSMPSMSRSPSSSSPPSASLTTQPSMTPSISLYPSMSPSSSSVPSTSSAPTETCFWIEITIVYDSFPEETWLELWKNVDVGQDYEGTRSHKEVEPGNYELVKLHDASLGDTLYSESICLQEGEYRFTIFDVWINGICCDFGSGNYNVTTSNGVLIAEGGMFYSAESTAFTIPFITAPSSMPSISRSPAASSSPSTIPSFLSGPSSISFASTIPPSTVTSSACTWIELSVIYNQYSAEVFGDMGASVDLYKRGVGGGGE